MANLLLIASLCTGQRPESLAAEIGSGGGGALKQLVTEALNEHLAAHRARRAQLLEDPDICGACCVRATKRLPIWRGYLAGDEAGHGDELRFLTGLVIWAVVSGARH
ncbi:hypothetical protein [Mobiluncus mulieris]|uniref:hypothetical protein n=1 Tax=Mobiluncus mulieris TaxID=2052 RepID=UPI003F497197